MSFSYPELAELHDDQHKYNQTSEEILGAKKYTDNYEYLFLWL